MRTLLDTLNEFDFSSMESDFLGSIYEKLIPQQERKRLGQFYTPPQIADLILSLTIKGKDEVVLDPACGSGTFLVRAYNRLKNASTISKDFLGGIDESYHKELLEKIYGIDINQFPAHLSVINLAIQNVKIKTDRVNVIVNDFVQNKARTFNPFWF
jgi:type I restriction-modification system DNA methylase subunit